MFWRKKGDGFEWHKYVRTTIKLRREDRRRRIDGALDAAAEGLKGVGRAGAERSFAWLDGLNRLIAAPFVLMGRLLTFLLDGAARLLRHPMQPLGRLLEQRGVVPALSLVATVSGLLGLGRASVEGFDQVALIEIAIAVAIGAALVLPPLITGRGLPMIAALPARLDDLRRRVPLLSGLSVSAQRGLTAAALALLVGGIGYVAVRAIGNLPAVTLSNITGPAKPPIEGRAQALSGDTLRVNATVVRLAGIEAPEQDQQCGGQGKEKRWKCGSAAQTALQEMVRGKVVRCDRGSTNEHGEVVTSCNIDGKDLGAELTSRGHVFATAGIFSSYGRQEQDARNAKLGVWRGTSERPAEYRARLWEVARKSAPDGCPIKGHLSGGERVYVVPWSPAYPRVKVQADRGGRWFCSEQEAQAAGWKAVSRS